MLTFLLLAAVSADLVVSVRDGDSLTLTTGEKIRLIGIDAPELKQPFGRQSKEHLSSLVLGKEVRIERIGRDRYGRTLAVVWVDQVNVNEDLIAVGLAWHYTRFSCDVRLRDFELDAREGRLGLWSDDEAISPWEWRKRK